MLRPSTTLAKAISSGVGRTDEAIAQYPKVLSRVCAQEKRKTLGRKILTSGVSLQRRASGWQLLEVQGMRFGFLRKNVAPTVIKAWGLLAKRTPTRQSLRKRIRGCPCLAENGAESGKLRSEESLDCSYGHPGATYAETGPALLRLKKTANKRCKRLMIEATSTCQRSPGTKIALTTWGWPYS